MTAIEKKLDALIGTNDQPPLVSYLPWYNTIAVVGGSPNVLDDDGRISSLRHIGRGDRLFEKVSAFSPAAPGTLNGIKFLDFANAEGQGTGNLSRGYAIPLATILEHGPITSLTIASIVRSNPSAGMVQAVVDITDPETDGVLLQQNIQSSGSTQFVARRTGADSSTAQSQTSAGYTNYYQTLISTVDYTATTGFINHHNLNNSLPSNTTLVNTADIGPADWHDETFIRVGKASDSSGRHLLNGLARLWVIPNMTSDQRSALVTFMTAIRVTLNSA